MSGDQKTVRTPARSSSDIRGPVHRLRRGALKLLLTPGLRRLYRPCLKGAAMIFMLHRFADPDRGVRGHDPAHLDHCLHWLRNRGRPVISLERLVRRLRTGGDLPPGAVVFTVDDGYYDFFQCGLPVFAKHDCPVTVFVPTGFVDGDCWMWWDKVEYAIRRTERRSVPSIDQDGHALSVEDSVSREVAVRRLVRGLERIPDRNRGRFIERLGKETEVPLPDNPPPEYRPLTWDMVRAAEEKGARFGPHSVTHPVLSMTSDGEVRHEIVGSWQRLREEAERPVPVFGYPRGAHWAFGEREVGIVRESGMVGAVSTRTGYAETALVEQSPWERRWAIPRFGFPREKEMFAQVASGLLRLRYLAAEDPRRLAAVYLDG